MKKFLILGIATLSGLLMATAPALAGTTVRGW
jgi:hypothetical protein